MKRKSLILILFMTAANCFAQDYFINFENDTVKCKIIELKAGKLKFETDNTKYTKKANKNSSFGNRKGTKKITSEYITEKIDNLKHIYVADESVIYNPLNIKIEEPEEGFAHVYFFRPYVYLNSALGCKIKYQGEKFLNVKTNGYYLHKIEAGKIHKYYKSRLGKDNVVEIYAENKKIYFVRGVLGSVNSIPGSEFNSPSGMPMMIGGQRNIVIDNSPNAKFHVMGMKKRLKAY